jgi:hypothetical protein
MTPLRENGPYAYFGPLGGWASPESVRRAGAAGKS